MTAKQKKWALYGGIAVGVIVVGYLTYTYVPAVKEQVDKIIKK